MPGLSVTTNDFNLATHNATITMVSPLTRNWRTFRVRTIKKGKLEGRRVVELLTGPDNLSSYQGFGTVEDDGAITVWKRFRGVQESTPPTVHEKFADMLCHPEEWQAK